jgi:hypothetical protein
LVIADDSSCPARHLAEEMRGFKSDTPQTMSVSLR